MFAPVSHVTIFLLPDKTSLSRSLELNEFERSVRQVCAPYPCMPSSYMYESAQRLTKSEMQARPDCWNTHTHTHSNTRLLRTNSLVAPNGINIRERWQIKHHVSHLSWSRVTFRVCYCTWPGDAEPACQSRLAGWLADERQRAADCSRALGASNCYMLQPQL